MDAFVEKFIWISFAFTWSVTLYVITRNFVLARGEHDEIPLLE